MIYAIRPADLSYDNTMKPRKQLRSALRINVLADERLRGELREIKFSRLKIQNERKIQLRETNKLEERTGKREENRSLGDFDFLAPPINRRRVATNVE